MSCLNICNLKRSRKHNTKEIKMTKICLFLLISSFISGCSNIKYNAKLFDSAADWVKEDFLKNNPTGYSKDNSYPTNRIFVVKSQNKYDEILIENINDLKVNFDNQMLIIYTFETIYHRNCSLVSLEVNQGTMNITYAMEKKTGMGDASQPYQRWFIVKLDRLDFDSVVFEKKE